MQHFDRFMILKYQLVWIGVNSMNFSLFSDCFIFCYFLRILSFENQGIKKRTLLTPPCILDYIKIAKLFSRPQNQSMYRPKIEAVDFY